MRYNVGDVVPFIHLSFLIGSMGNRPSDPKGFWRPLFLPWNDTLEGMDIRLMECKEHHKVAWRYDEKGEKKYDGFVFEETDDPARIWHNQYPTADYGQLDDSANRIVRLRCDDPAAAKELIDSESLVYMRCAFDYLRTVKRGCVNDQLSAEQQQALSQHFDDVVKAVEEKSGRKIVMAPDMVPRGDDNIQRSKELLALIKASAPDAAETSSLREMARAHNVSIPEDFPDFAYIHPNEVEVHLPGWYNIGFAEKQVGS